MTPDIRTDPHMGERRMHRFFQRLLVLEGLALVAAGLVTVSINLPLLPIRLASGWVLLAGLVIAALACWGRPWRAQTLMAGALSLALLLVGGAAGYRPLRNGDWSMVDGRMRIWNTATDWTEKNHRSDNVLGWTAEPGIVARQHHHDFDVTYRNDAQGWRRMPERPAGLAGPSIWFLGCSFTYGVGVEDEETYSYRLAERAWPQARVRNISASGWGTNNAYRALQQQLASNAAPAAVFYGWISHHRKRNYLRGSWFGEIRATAIPWFEVEDGHLVSKGMARHEQAIIPDSPALDDKEVQVSLALIRGMAGLARERGVPFVLLVLQANEDPVIEVLRQAADVNILDLSQVSNAMHPNEGHPSPVWHQAMAHAIAADPLLARLTGDPRWQAPDVIADPPMRRMALSVDANLPKGDKSWVQWPRQAGEALRAVPTPSQIGDPWSIVLKAPAVPLRKGQVYALDMRIRADRPRRLSYLIGRDHAPWGDLGLAGEIRVGREWQTRRQTFVASDDDVGRLMLLLGGEATAVELAQEPVLRELGGPEAESARAELRLPAWVLNQSAGVSAGLDAGLARQVPPFSVAIDRLPQPDPWAVQLRCGGLQLRAGQAYRLEVRVRSSEKRPLTVGISQDHAPWANRGLLAEVLVGGEWQTLSLPFTASHDEPGAQLVLALGAHRARVDVASVRLMAGDTDLLLPPR